MTSSDTRERLWVRAVVAGAGLIAVLIGSAATAASAPKQHDTQLTVAWNSTGSDYNPPNPEV
ncbi:hypothetical protein [Streptomyces sp. NPDC048106]|uniref:hypothetical protein n=1 Tax=Streptomyces sp. NPDC048106 TaxID=3155750 RepID=UPI0034563A77